LTELTLEYYSVMVNSDELIGTTEYLMLYTRCRINWHHYSRVWPYLCARIQITIARCQLLYADSLLWEMKHQLQWVTDLGLQLCHCAVIYGTSLS